MNNLEYKFLYIVAVIIAISYCLTGCNPSVPVQTGNLKVEYLSDPMGIDTEQPRFSWNLISDERNISQSSYQIIVSPFREEAGSETEPVWDTGKTDSGNTIHIEYSGKPLQSNTKYQWQVCSWIDEETFVWSEPSCFHTGILDKDEWNAKWITTQSQVADKSPLLRKKFVLNQPVKQAFAFVTAV